jgi:tetratricopeptide (TPR) repeat protein
MDTFEMAKLLFLTGLKHFENQEFQNAEDSFLKSLKLVPDRESTLINLAATQIKLKKFDEAEINLKQIKDGDGKSIDLWLNLGALYLERNKISEAVAYFEKYVELNPHNILAWKLIGQAYEKKGELNKAISCFKQILEFSPDDLDAQTNIGAILNELRDYEASIHYHQSVIEIDPNSANGYVNMGVALTGLKKFDLALSKYSAALELDSEDEEIWFNKGNTLCALIRYDEALIHYEKALTLRPDFTEAYSQKGNALHELKRFDEAIFHYDKALNLKPDYAEGWSNKGVTLHELKRFDEAIFHYDKALSLKPDYHEAWSNKGLSLHQIKRFDEAIAHYEKALSLKPDYAKGWSNKGVTLHQLKRFDEAIANYDKALSLKPDYHEASWNKSLSLLLQGDFENGLPLYESRWDLENGSEIVGKRFFDKPTWLGINSLKDKIILLYAEQGLGDSIQFCRYVKLVAGLGSKVILEVPQSLAGLMKGLEGVSQLVIKGEDLPFFDYQCPLLSLPLAFKTNLNTIPNPSRYINLDNHSNKIMEWKERLGLKTKPRVGLVWSGNSNHKNDHNRSLLLQEILPFLSNQYEYISLQKEVREIDKLTLGSNPHILSFNSYLNDFLDTAALIDNLDLVISVDTSVAHLSAALEKKTLVLLPGVPDWRWLFDREDSPWYSSIKLYRQPVIGDWNSVLDRVKFDLNDSYDFQ